MFMRDRNTRQYQLALSPQARVMKSWERRERRNPITGQYRGDHEPTQLDEVAEQFDTYARHIKPSPPKRPHTAHHRSQKREHTKIRNKPVPVHESQPAKKNSPSSPPLSARSTTSSRYSRSSNASSAPSESYFHSPNSPLSRKIYRIHQYSDSTQQQGDQPKPYNAFLTDPVARDRNLKTKERIEWVSKYKKEIDSKVDHEDRKYRQKKHMDKVSRQEKLRSELDKQTIQKHASPNRSSENIIFGRDDLKRRDEWRKRSQTLRQDQLNLIAQRTAQSKAEKKSEIGFEEQPIFVARQQQIQNNSRKLAQQLREDNLALMKQREQSKREASRPVYYKSSLFY